MIKIICKRAECHAIVPRQSLAFLYRLASELEKLPVETPCVGDKPIVFKLGTREIWVLGVYDLPIAIQFLLCTEPIAASGNLACSSGAQLIGMDCKSSIDGHVASQSLYGRSLLSEF